MSDPRRQARRIAYGTATRLAGRVLGALVSLVALRAGTRYFGPTHWGSVTAAVAWFTVFSALGGPGIATLAMRESARPESDARIAFGRGLVATALVSAGGAVVAAAVGGVAYAGKGETQTAVLVLAAGVPLWALFTTSSAVLSGRDRNDLRALLDVLSSVLLLVATLTVVHERLSVGGYAVAYLGYLLVSAGGALALAAVVVRPRLSGSWTAFRGQVRASLSLGQFDIFASVYARADSIMVFFINGERPVALYGVAFQIATFLFVVPSLLSSALLPDFMAASQERRQLLARRGLDVVLTAALPLPVFGVVFARTLVVWIAGEGFAGAGPLLAILTFAAAAALLNGYLYQIAIFAGAEHGLWRVILTVTVVNLAANAVAVSFWAATGAAVVMVLSEVVGLVLYWRVYRERMPSPLGRRYPLSALAGTVGLIGACLGLHTGFGLGPGAGVGILPRAAVLLTVYLLLLLAVVTGARKLAAAPRPAGTRP